MNRPDKRCIEKLTDEVILETLDLEPHQKAVTAIVLEVHRALHRLKQTEERSIGDMDRSFIIQHFAGRSFDEAATPEVRKRVELALDADDPAKEIRRLIRNGM